MDTGEFTGFEVTLREPGIAWFRFNTPERLNGMTTGIKRDLVELQRIPIVETIEVQVNDVAHEQWQYEADLNAVRFMQDAPSGGESCAS